MSVYVCVCPRGKSEKASSGERERKVLSPVCEKVKRERVCVREREKRAKEEAGKRQVDGMRERKRLEQQQQPLHQQQQTADGLGCRRRVADSPFHLRLTSLAGRRVSRGESGLHFNLSLSIQLRGKGGKKS